MAGKAYELIDMREQKGKHPRIAGKGARGYLYTHMDQYITENLLR